MLYFYNKVKIFIRLSVLFWERFSVFLPFFDESETGKLFVEPCESKNLKSKLFKDMNTNMIEFQRKILKTMNFILNIFSGPIRFAK